MAKARKQNGFTLAEVLITLGIIGVVAAMAIPPLMNKTNDAELRAKYKKVFSEISQANQQLVMDNGGTLESLFTASTTQTDFKNLFKPYLNTVKDCDAGASAGICWHTASGWKSATGDPTDVSANNLAAVVLNNGAMIEFRTNASYVNCTGTCGAIQRCGWMQVDVNGFQKPNVIGKDIFVINIQKDKATPSGITGDCDFDNCGATVTNAVTPAFAGNGCGAWVILGKDY